MSVNSIRNEYGVLGSLLIDPSLFPEAAELPDDVFSSVPLQESSGRCVGSMRKAVASMR